jgi:hypothetical protein
LESPELVEAMKKAFSGKDAKTVVVEAGLKVDFANSKIIWGGREFGVSPTGRPVQEVILAGGVENLVRAALK